MKKVLLVEDDAEQVAIFRIPFELTGFTIVSESDSKKVLAKAVEWRPDVILLDLVMEDVDGLEVLRRLKSNEQTKNIPVAILTNVSAKEKMEEAKALGATDFWEKTKVMPQEIVKKCKEILGMQ
ncbi:MAG: response regulator [Candidatus Sungiibacteriota bacterium]